MRRRSLSLVGALGMLLPALPLGAVTLTAASPVAAATCDSYAVGTASAPTSVSASPTPIAPSGSLAAGSSAKVTITAMDSAGNCVSNAPVELQFSGPGSAVPGTPGTSSYCANTAATLTPNWTRCTTDASGTVTVTYETPPKLPNGGTSVLEASTQVTAVEPAAQATTSYTYASMNLATENISAAEGTELSGPVAQMTYSNFTYTPQATIDWGDGTTSVGSVSGSGGADNFVVSGSHLYQEESPTGYTITVTGFANDGPTVSSTGGAAVADAALTATGTSLSGRARLPISTSVAGFTDADPAGTVTDYRATTSWGDGTSSTGAVSQSGREFFVSGSHTYKRRGDYSIRVTITDAGGSTALAQTVASVR